MTATIKSDLIGHLKNALTKKAILLPFIAPCYVAWFVCAFVWDYLSDFVETIKRKKDDERQAYIDKRNAHKEQIESKGIFAFYALTATVLYWFLFGFSRDMTALQFLNYPAYFLGALPIEAIHQLSILPIHYKTH